ncbi:hypothetical protein [Paralcaligenes ureilyticus]|uniref:Oligosaccharide repeat unit polymerase n=1 Tax=Paralcaligenes ureilyticus TaxID=627131 RepID=A0A4R3M6N3_9BURK|nr:hypothetical protein [Paralcaligenes ureilyticus]TCT09074.1 hypothetical protein EDC26_104234 [Paralcaligenes ureilyticus]
MSMVEKLLRHKLLGFWSLPVFIIFFIIPQAFFAALGYGDYLSLLILIIALVSIGGYLFGGGIALSIFRKRILHIDGWRSIIFHFLLFLYLFSYLCLYMKYGGVPFIDMLVRGGNSDLMRADFYKNQEGVWKVLTYFISILSKGFLPFAIIILFCIKRRVSFYLYLFAFTFISISALEKAPVVFTYIPLLLFTFFNGYKKSFIMFSFIAVLGFSSVSFVALGSDLALNGNIQEGPTYLVSSTHSESPKHALYTPALPATKINVSLADEKSYQFLFYNLDSGNKVEYLINRLIWIPYVTVYDTVLYWQENYKGYVFFSVNRYLSMLFGDRFADLERQVFRFQFGSGEDTTGNANASYMAEAYVGFGFPGIIIFSFLIGMIFGGTVRTGVLPFIYSLPVIALGLISASLLSTLFSGGLIFFVIFVFIFSTRLNPNSANYAPRNEMRSEI